MPWYVTGNKRLNIEAPFFADVYTLTKYVRRLIFIRSNRQRPGSSFSRSYNRIEYIRRFIYDYLAISQAVTGTVNTNIKSHTAFRLHIFIWPRPILKAIRIVYYNSTERRNLSYKSAVTDYPWGRWGICPQPRRAWIAPRPRRNAPGPGGLGLSPGPGGLGLWSVAPWSQLSIKPTPGQLGESATAKVRPCDAARVKEYNEY